MHQKFLLKYPYYIIDVLMLFILHFYCRLLILDIITEQLSSGEENSYFIVPRSSIYYLKKVFIEYVMNIVQICNNENTDMVIFFYYYLYF